MRYLAITLTLILLPADRAPAHEFSLGVHASGDDAYQRVVAAVRGALLAADERDGHPEETSDGHLGGVDVHLVPLEEDRRFTLPELKNTHRGELDFLLALDPGGVPGAGVPGMTDHTIILQPGELPDAHAWSGNSDSASFGARYRDAWAMEADVHSAQGYNAARRLNDAIRPHDGVDQTEAIRDALLRSRAGIDWR